MNLMNPCSRSATRRAALLGLSLLAASWLSPAARADTVAPPAAQAPLWAAAGQEQPALLETLRALVNIESGSSDREGLDQIFKAAGFEWREPGCSMCLAMNADRLEPGERCASTSNRNFEGRQGAGGRTHLVSPAMAAAAAMTGHFVDVRTLS